MTAKKGRLGARAVDVSLLLFCLLLTASWFVFLLGSGMASIYAWIVLLQIIPLLSLTAPIALVVVTLITRHKKHAPGRRRPKPWRIILAVGVTILGLWPVLWNFGITTLRFPSTLEHTRPVVMGRLPSNLPLRVVWGGDALAVNHHAASPDQRWAYDFVVEPALFKSPRLADYGCFGTLVVAPVSGVVQVAQDGEQDRVPTLGRHEMDLATPLGNHVAIALDAGGYVIVAHLKRGSVTVRQGERIEEGTPIGACGNSGNSTEPHIHVHAQRQDPTARPLNFSEGLPLFFHQHDGDAMPLGGVRTENGKKVAIGATVRHLGFDKE